MSKSISVKMSIKMDALNAVSVLSAFNWYKVTAENTEDGNRTFFATGIEAQFDGAVVKIEKQFSNPVYIAGYCSVRATAENIIVFEYTNGGSYTVEGQRKDFADPDQYSGDFISMEELLADPDKLEALTDYKRSHKDENGNLLVVLDLRKLGRITAANAQRIKSFFNVHCGGNTKNQNPRSLYFKFMPDNAVYMGIWNYATEQPLTEKYMVTEEEALCKLAQSVTAAI